METVLRVIGDVHGRYQRYIDLTRSCQNTICVGDVGFDYRPLEYLDSRHHRIVAGNHDNYRAMTQHFLGDYGEYEVPGFGKIFFARGGYSIDRSARQFGIDWFPEEEMSEGEMACAFSAYEKAKPDIVISHECPNQIKDMIPFFRNYSFGPVPISRTSRLLDVMFDAHQPKEWIFGHYHCDWSATIRGTRFTCLGILSTKDYIV